MHNFKIIKKAQLLLGFFILLGLFSCSSPPEEIHITGFTMGTTYSIKIVNDSDVDVDQLELKVEVDSVLVSFNQQVSTYIDNSEISIFNARSDTGWEDISDEFHEIVSIAENVSKLTEGAFDITVGPLVNVWGFGTSNQLDWEPPKSENIVKIMNAVGYKNIEVGDGLIRKLNAATTIDLNAIAKGYGVDIVVDFLKKKGFYRILVEIGGEVRCSGKNRREQIWSVGIDQPIFDNAPGSSLQDIIGLDNSALATSGDYRNYFYYDDKVFSHTIDPITGYPIEDGIASASVIAPTCIMADALATALMVIGTDGINLIEQLDGVETLLVKRLSEGMFKTVTSSGWPVN